MMIWYAAMKRRKAAAVALAAVAAFVLTGCGSDSDSQQDKNPPQKSRAPKGDERTEEVGSTAPEPTQTLAEVKGEQDVVIAITEAVRDSGGFVTVQGTITNNGDSSFSGAIRWRGGEEELTGSGASVAGAVLVDQAGKKRYYVLRDTEGRCLCTTGLVSIKSKETRPFFAQFPAPPEGTTKVEFQLPTMPPAQIEISG